MADESPPERGSCSEVDGGDHSVFLISALRVSFGVATFGTPKWPVTPSRDLSLALTNTGRQD